MNASRDDLVLFLAHGARDGAYGFDPVRLMKACFITAMAAPEEEWRELFDFGAYDYGPFDKGVYDARDALVGQGLLDIDRSGRYERYVTSEAGAHRVAELKRDLDPIHADWLERVGKWVVARSFTKLLDEVYARWPEYAVRSVRW